MRNSIKKLFKLKKGGGRKEKGRQNQSSATSDLSDQEAPSKAKITLLREGSAELASSERLEASGCGDESEGEGSTSNAQRIESIESNGVQENGDRPNQEGKMPGKNERGDGQSGRSDRPSGDDDAESLHVFKSYDLIPVLEQTKLPRGGVSVETKAVGRVQFGIPPETIKDSMKLGLPVPQVYIVPVERFCREMGPALGVNLAEFEFPAYFNFFVYKKRCTLVVDSQDAEDNIRRVFSETLLGPAQFRREEDPITYEPEDFAPDFPKEAIPNFQKELQHFRIMPDGKELVIETLLDFRHFHSRTDGHDNLGVPPPLGGGEDAVLSTEEEEKVIEQMHGDTDDEVEEEIVPIDETAVEKREESKNPWTYSQAKFTGDVAIVWPKTATEEQKKKRNVARVEIFKMPGGTEYIIHDVDERNFIIGKARVSGHVKVSESMSVDGFGGHSIMDDLGPEKESEEDNKNEEGESSHHLEEIFSEEPPTFHPPSFGVTVLGNSHGFDKSGSVSGYVLWINGRGVMIDPPPYSSATLEREGIRPRTIVGIILTHCHADHDAGAFQKVLTGSPVVVITTPTIYKSFIRKYAALSALSPALLRHSHRYKPAFIGQPLRFQGATFHFTYSLHTIPCVGFRVEWRGRSMVFTADHFNSPDGMQKLEASGVLSKARHEDLKNFVLQDTDVLLHEAGAPPIHTPLSALIQLPEHVKKRMYVVHTSALPEDCELQVAPTGTKGTIRLDQIEPAMNNISTRSFARTSERGNASNYSINEEYDEPGWNSRSEYSDDRPKVSASSKSKVSMYSSFAHLENPSFANRRKSGRNSVFQPTLGSNDSPPLVALRPASSTDAWFILNLLSAVPFISSLSYTSTMELLETARVDAFKKDDIIVPASRRSQLLCVVWEGTCAEFPVSDNEESNEEISKGTNPKNPGNNKRVVWHAGDWTGPIALQPDRRISGESSTSQTHDIVAVSSEGVKVITVEYANLHSILKNGSGLYRKYLERKTSREKARMDVSSSDQHSNATEKLLDDALRDLNVLELLNCNSALRKLNAVQKRHLESLAEGPVSYQPGERLWRAGCPVDKAFVIVSGSASFVPRRRNAGSATGDGAAGLEMQIDARKAVKELGRGTFVSDADSHSLSSLEVDDHKEPKPQSMSLEKVFQKSGGGDSQNPDFEKLRQGLEMRAKHVNMEGSVNSEYSMGDSHDHESFDTDNESAGMIDHTFADEHDGHVRSSRQSMIRRRSSRARKANKVLGRLYNRRAFTGGLVFSRGHFLGDVSKMVAGLLASDVASESGDMGPSYGFGDSGEGSDEGISDQIIPEDEDTQRTTHSSVLTAGKDGCVALVFHKSSLIPFLDEYPGLLLSLLGTQVVV